MKTSTKLANFSGIYVEGKSEMTISVKSQASNLIVYPLRDPSATSEKYNFHRLFTFEKQILLYMHSPRIEGYLPDFLLQILQEYYCPIMKKKNSQTCKHTKKKGWECAEHVRSLQLFATFQIVNIVQGVQHMHKTNSPR
jgi:hypothetical protein